MTTDSKENLLQVLLNKQTGAPGEEEITYYNKTTQLVLEGTADVFVYDGKLIKIYQGNIYVYDSNDNLIYQQEVKVNNSVVMYGHWDIDDEGNLYSIYSTYTDSLRYWLAYWNNPTIPQANGEYEFRVKRTYDITSVLQNATKKNTSVVWTSGAVGDIILKKCPFDSRFFIGVSRGLGTKAYYYDFAGIIYTVNVGSQNSYQYIQNAVGIDYINIVNAYVAWTTSDCQFCVLATESTTDMSANVDGKGNVSLYEYKGQVAGSSITGTKIKDINDCIAPYYQINCEYFDTTHKYISYRTDTNDTLTAYLYYYNVNTENLIKSITQSPSKYTITTSGSSSSYYFENSYTIAKTTDSEIFAGEYSVGEQHESGIYYTKFAMLHLDEENIINETLLKDNIVTIINYKLLLKKEFNLYQVYYARTLKATFVYNVGGYNGQSYIGNKSITGESGIILKNDVPIFARDLYNAEQINNQITNILQIPNYSVNGMGETTQTLISKTNTNIEENIQDISKNKYEQVFINFIEQIKVYNNNIGTEYNQPTAYKVAEQIFNGFEDNYKITNYRIHYKDNTTKDKSITNCSIESNIATIRIYEYNSGIDYIELYDSNYTIPFIKIDTSDLEEDKIIGLTQYIKVE